jgi:hypothetical protein
MRLDLFNQLGSFLSLTRGTAMKITAGDAEAFSNQSAEIALNMPQLPKPCGRNFQSQTSLSIRWIFGDS